MENSLNTIDSLVDFGMSVAVAQQMINTMNHCIANMAVPGVSSRPITILLPNYYIVKDGQQAGPYTESDLERLIKSGDILAETLVWHAGLTGWTQAKNISEIGKILLLNGSL